MRLFKVVEHRPPSVAALLAVGVKVGNHDMIVEWFPVGLSRNMCPPLHVSSELWCNSYFSTLVVVYDGVNLAKEEASRWDGEE
jgi:hypothetical protein